MEPADRAVEDNIHSEPNKIIQASQWHFPKVSVTVDRHPRLLERTSQSTRAHTVGSTRRKSTPKCRPTITVFSQLLPERACPAFAQLERNRQEECVEKPAQEDVASRSLFTSMAPRLRQRQLHPGTLGYLLTTHGPAPSGCLFRYFGPTLEV